MVKRRIRALMTVLLASACASVAGGSDETAVPAVSTLRGAGQWGDVKVEAEPDQRWNMEALQYSGDKIAGRVVITGSPIMDSANLEGQFSGRGITGTLSDDDGKELAEFEGRVTASGAAGSYRDFQGGSGTWQLDGKLKR